MPQALKAMPTKSTQVMPNEILAILILPKSSPMKMDKAKYRMVGPTPEPVKRLDIKAVFLLALNRGKSSAFFYAGSQNPIIKPVDSRFIMSFKTNFKLFCRTKERIL